MGKNWTTPNPGRIDLNLLRVFDAVFEDQNLVRAGKRLHLSQSAISHALSRLREALQDELFVRTAKGMEPTARALAMAAQLREALRSIHDTLGVRPFDPAPPPRKSFVLAANDYVTSVLLTRLSRHYEGAGAVDRHRRAAFHAAGPGRADRCGPDRHRDRHLCRRPGAFSKRPGLDARRCARHAQGPSVARGAS